MSNKVKYGLCNVYVAPILAAGPTGVTYDSPFKIPGAVDLTLDPEGESADFFGDNTKYFSQAANQGYTGNLEIALLTDEFKTKILGEQVDGNGAMFENSDDEIKDFALGFQIDGDKTNSKFWFYNVSAKRPSTSSSTTETSKEPQTDTLDITATPRISDNQVKVRLEKSDSNTVAYNTFFDNVYEKLPSA